MNCIMHLLHLNTRASLTLWSAEPGLFKGQNRIRERRTQKEGERLCALLVYIKTKSAQCGFGGLRLSLRDAALRVVGGVRQSAVIHNKNLVVQFFIISGEIISPCGSLSKTFLWKKALTVIRLL